MIYRVQFNIKLVAKLQSQSTSQNNYLCTTYVKKDDINTDIKNRCTYMGLTTVNIDDAASLQPVVLYINSVKYYPGGRKMDHILSIFCDIVTNVVLLCSVYKAPLYEPNLTLLAWFLICQLIWACYLFLWWPALPAVQVTTRINSMLSQLCGKMCQQSGISFIWWRLVYWIQCYIFVTVSQILMELGPFVVHQDNI